MKVFEQSKSTVGADTRQTLKNAKLPCLPSFTLTLVIDPIVRISQSSQLASSVENQMCGLDWIKGSKDRNIENQSERNQCPLNRLAPSADSHPISRRTLNQKRRPKICLCHS